MHIEGDINIMGLKEVLFRNFVRDRDGKCDYQLYSTYIKHGSLWVRSYEGVPGSYHVTDHKMMKTIKSLAKNFTLATLTFNNGAMYIDLCY